MDVQSPIAAHPFGLLADPLATERALAGSQRLECLNRRICRPLDRMTVPVDGLAESTGFDEEDASLSRH
jgi:hypothetical protein